jgi:7 transmembrane receptor (rhodopsin family)
MTFCYVNVVLVVWKRSRELTAESAASGSEDTVTRNVCNGESAAATDADRHVAVTRTTSWKNSSFVLRKLRSVDSGDGCESSPGHSAGGASVQLRRSLSDSRSVFRARARTVQLTLCIVCLFIACWTPYFVVHLVHIWSEYSYHIPERVYVSAETLALVNSAVNPVLYGCFHAKLCKRGRHGSRNHSSLTRWNSIQSTRTALSIYNHQNKQVDTTVSGSERIKNGMQNWSRFTDNAAAAAATRWGTNDDNKVLQTTGNTVDDSLQLTKLSESRLTRSGRVVTFLPENGANYDSRYN